MRLVAVLGRGLVPVDTPILRADDLGLQRGDGIFETMHVRTSTTGPSTAGPSTARVSRPWLLDEHLARMANSAARMDLQLPAGLAEFAQQTCAAWPAAQGEGALKLVCTRGSEETGQVTCFAMLSPVSATARAARDTGITVQTLSLGYAAHARADAPWLLGGVKSLSYAINMASQRWGVTHGTDDVLWVSADGYVLEAPTSTLVWRAGDRLLTVPAGQTGILAGTTARYALDHAGELGLTAAEQLVTPAELRAADGVWLLSSVRGIASITSLDGVALRPARDTARLRALLGF